jgi:hypothetical protein
VILWENGIWKLSKAPKVFIGTKEDVDEFGRGIVKKTQQKTTKKEVTKTEPTEVIEVEDKVVPEELDTNDLTANFKNAYNPDDDIAEQGFESQKALGDMLKDRVKTNTLRYKKNMRNGEVLSITVQPVTNPNHPIFQFREGSIPLSTDTKPEDFHKVPVEVIITDSKTGRKFKSYYKDVQGISTQTKNQVLDELHHNKATVLENAEFGYNEETKTTNIPIGTTVVAIMSRVNDNEETEEFPISGTLLELIQKPGRVQVAVIKTPTATYNIATPSVYAAKDVLAQTTPEAIAQRHQEFEAQADVKEKLSYLSPEQLTKYRRLIEEACEAHLAGRQVNVKGFSITKGDFTVRKSNGKRNYRNLNDVRALVGEGEDLYDNEWTNEFGPNTKAVISVATSQTKDGTVLVAPDGHVVHLTPTDGSPKHARGAVYMHIKEENGHIQAVKLNKAQLTEQQTDEFVNMILPEGREVTPKDYELASLLCFNGAKTVDYYWEKGNKSAFYLGYAIMYKGRLIADKKKADAIDTKLWANATLGCWVRPGGGTWTNTRSVAGRSAEEKAKMRAKIKEAFKVQPLNFSVDQVDWGSSLRRLLNSQLSEVKPDANGNYTVMNGVQFNQTDVDAGKKWVDVMIDQSMIVSDLSDDMFNAPYLNIYTDPTPTVPEPKEPVKSPKKAPKTHEEHKAAIREWINSHDVPVSGRLVEEMERISPEIGAKMRQNGVGLTTNVRRMSLEQYNQMYLDIYGKELTDEVHGESIDSDILMVGSASDQTLKHEAVHAVLAEMAENVDPDTITDIIEETEGFITNLGQLIDVLGAKVPTEVKTLYSILKKPNTHWSEIYAYAFSHPKIADWLSSQDSFNPYTEVNGESLWATFKNIILKLFDRIFGSNPNLMDELQAILDGAFTNEQTEETIAEVQTSGEITYIYNSPEEFGEAYFGSYEIDLSEEVTIPEIRDVEQLGNITRSLALMATMGTNSGLVEVSSVSITNLKNMLRVWAANGNVHPTRQNLYRSLLDNWDKGIGDMVEYELSKSDLFNPSANNEGRKLDEYEQILTNDENIKPAEKLSQRIKQMLRTIPKYTFRDGKVVPVYDADTGLVVPEDLQRRLPKMYNDLMGVSTAEELLQRMLDLSKHEPFYKALYGKLTSEKNGVDPREAAINNHNMITELYTFFAMTKVNYSSVYYEAKEGSVSVGYSRNMTDSKAETDYNRLFGLNLANKALLWREDGSVNQTEIDQIIKDFGALRVSSLDLADYEGNLCKFTALCSRVGIEITPYVVEELLIKEINPNSGTIFGADAKGLRDYLNLVYRGKVVGSRVTPMLLFSENGIGRLNEYTKATVGRFYKENANRAAAALGRNLASSDPIRQHSMIEGPDGKEYYSISETNTITDLVKMLSQRKSPIAKELYTRLKNDTFSADS